MATQTSTTGALEDASREMIVQARYTEEHNAPCINLIEKFNLKQGEDTIVVPKVGQMTMRDLAEGEEIDQEEDIGMSTVNSAPNEVGGKVVITDKLLRQNVNNIWRMVGRQLGEAMARKKDEDIISRFSGLNGGTDLGLAGRVLSAQNAFACIANAKAENYGTNLNFIHHPNAIFRLNQDLSVIGSSAGVTAPMPRGYSESRLRNFWTGIKLGQVPFWEDGNISEDGDGDGIGVLMDKSAVGIVQSVVLKRERERKPSLRGWVLYLTADYSTFEIDDTRGAPTTFDVANPATT